MFLSIRRQYIEHLFEGAACLFMQSQYNFPRYGRSKASATTYEIQDWIFTSTRFQVKPNPHIIVKL